MPHLYSKNPSQPTPTPLPSMRPLQPSAASFMRKNLHVTFGLYILLLQSPWPHTVFFDLLIWYLHEAIATWRSSSQVWTPRQWKGPSWSGIWWVETGTCEWRFQPQVNLPFEWRGSSHGTYSAYTVFLVFQSPACRPGARPATHICRSPLAHRDASSRTDNSPARHLRWGTRVKGLILTPTARRLSVHIPGFLFPRIRAF